MSQRRKVISQKPRDDCSKEVCRTSRRGVSREKEMIIRANIALGQIRKTEKCSFN